MALFKQVANTLAIIRPANTTQYAAGDLLAATTTAGSVVMQQFNVGSLTQGKIIGGKARKSTNTVTTASFRLHIFNVGTKTVTNGDNGAIVVNSMDGYIGFLDFDFATIGADTNIIGGAIEKIAAAPTTPLVYKTVNNLYGLVEVTGAYTPGSGDVFNFWLNLER